MLIAAGEPSGSHPVVIAQGAASVPRGLAPEDMLAIREVGEIAVSPDAASVVFTVSTSDLATNRTRSQVMIVPNPAENLRRSWSCQTASHISAGHVTRPGLPFSGQETGVGDLDAGWPRAL